MKKFLSSIVLLVIFFTSGCAENLNKQIIECNSSSDIDYLLSNIHEKYTLVIFDCEDVLVTPVDLIFQDGNLKKMRAALDRLLHGLKKSKMVDFYSKMFAYRKMKLVDENWPQKIAMLQKQGIKVLMLTNSFRGSYGVVNSIENLRKLELNKLGIDFEKSWESIDTIEFEELGKGTSSTFKYAPINCPIYMQGMIFTANIDKGLVLQSFLKKIPQKFKQVIFIDDKVSNLISVQSAVQNMGLDFTGVHYNVVKKQNKNAKFNQTKAEMQLTNLYSKAFKKGKKK